LPVIVPKDCTDPLARVFFLDRRKEEVMLGLPDVSLYKGFIVGAKIPFSFIGGCFFEKI
jgi:hypothetical protein